MFLFLKENKMTEMALRESVVFLYLSRSLKIKIFEKIFEMYEKVYSH